MTTAGRVEHGTPEMEEGFCAMIGQHPSMLSLFDAMRRAAASQAPVLIEGPTGVGKELVAAGLHRLSGVRGPLVALNVACLPESIVESELFGAVRGAFTGSGGDRAGVVATAEGGTLFLDEAGDLTTAVQAKLLRTLESGLYRPVGACRERTASFRLVMTVQEPPRCLLADGRWRPDFYYRTAGIVLSVPALQARPTDIALLARYLLRRAGAEPPTASALEGIASYSWPGNVRQLKRAVERAVFRAGVTNVCAESILEAARDMDPDWSPTRRQSGDAPVTLHDQERARIVEALEGATSTRQAAADLGLSIHQLYRRLHNHGISTPRGGESRKRN